MGNSVSVQEKVSYVAESSYPTRAFHLPRTALLEYNV